jgi:hypothetical protein
MKNDYQHLSRLGAHGEDDVQATAIKKRKNKQRILTLSPGGITLRWRGRRPALHLARYVQSPHPGLASRKRPLRRLQAGRVRHAVQPLRHDEIRQRGRRRAPWSDLALRSLPLVFLQKQSRSRQAVPRTAEPIRVPTERDIVWSCGIFR